MELPILREVKFSAFYLARKHCNASFQNTLGLFREKNLRVCWLSKQFPNPKTIVHNVIATMVSLNKSYAPTMVVTSKLRGQIWKASLTFKWPLKFTTTGRSSDRKRARYYAYLTACDMLQNIGLLAQYGQPIDYKEELFAAQDRLMEDSQYCKTVLNYSSTRQQVKGEQQWMSTLHIDWPYNLTVMGQGTSQQAAEHNASLVAFIKLKGRKQLTRFNKIICPNLTCMPTWSGPDLSFQPTFEFYVDASKVGYGAYLLRKNDNSKVDDTAKRGGVRWLHDTWPEEVQHKFVDTKPKSSFLEFYGILGAVFTWKKKFQDCHVLCWTDSLSVVRMINWGISDGNNLHWKLYMVLIDTCKTYRITLRLQHISRMDNQAADCLSKSKLEEFQKMVPNADYKAKKPKKLMFFNPLVQPQSAVPPGNNSSDTVHPYQSQSQTSAHSTERHPSSRRYTSDSNTDSPCQIRTLSHSSDNSILPPET